MTDSMLRGGAQFSIWSMILGPLTSLLLVVGLLSLFFWIWKKFGVSRPVVPVLALSSVQALSWVLHTALEVMSTLGEVGGEFLFSAFNTLILVILVVWIADKQSRTAVCLLLGYQLLSLLLGLLRFDRIAPYGMEAFLIQIGIIALSIHTLIKLSRTVHEQPVDGSRNVAEGR